MKIAIAGPDDPRIAPYRFVRERDLHRGDGLFVAEGEVVVRRLLASPLFDTHSVLASPARVAALAGILSALDDPPPLYVAEEPVLSGIAGFPLHRGLLALGKRGEGRDAAALIAASRRVLVAIGIANHDNMGALFRNAAAFGADALLCDETSCDPLYRKAIRVSVGAALSLPFASAPADKLIGALAVAGFELLALTPGGAEELRHVRPPDRFALIVGAEGPGLPGAILARCRGIGIRMAGGLDSLNVATTAAIALNHLAG